MIHFIQGLSSKTIYLEALLNKLNIDNISRFDETNSEFFLNEINSGSLFSEPKIVLLKIYIKYSKNLKIMKIQTKRL